MGSVCNGTRPPSGEEAFISVHIRGLSWAGTWHWHVVLLDGRYGMGMFLACSMLVACGYICLNFSLRHPSSTVACVHNVFGTSCVMMKMYICDVCWLVSFLALNFGDGWILSVHYIKSRCGSLSSFHRLLYSWCGAQIWGSWGRSTVHVVCWIAFHVHACLVYV